MMRRHTTSVALLCALLAIGGASAAVATPQIGYCYPAGGQQGTSFTVEIGGQALRDVDQVDVSGSGVSAYVIDYAPPLRAQDSWPTRRYLTNVVRVRWVKSAMEQAAQSDDELPDNPWLRGLDEMSPLELERLRRRFFDPKAQPDAQIADQLIVEVTVAPDALPGDRELRVGSPAGLSNPIRFQVGTLPELVEKQFAPVGSPSAQVVEPPVMLNGQILPGEVDRLQLRARRGQRLVIQLQGRALMPYLADAVPGWFQATMALYDPSGREVAFSDDYRFDPDPIILYEVPEDGIYQLEVRDAIYRGREDFVYRIAIGELPFVTGVFPLGGREGEDTVVQLSGWNLPSDALRLDTSPGGRAVREATIGSGHAAKIAYAVDRLPEVVEVEPNDTAAEAQPLTPPVIVNGRIDRPGDVDQFSFEGRAGEELVAEVFARRLGSPLDSALRLTGPGGELIAFNDDHKDPVWGLMTHHADSYIRVELPADGAYLLRLFDAQGQGGEEFAYRLHLRPPEPDFALRLEPSAVNVRPGRTAEVRLHAMRRDGFDRAIEIELLEGPEGFALSPLRIPEGESVVEATLSAPRGAGRQVAPLRLEGRAEIGGRTVRRPVAPAEDQMQAFLWRFIVPQERLLVAVSGARPVPAVWRPLAEGFELQDERALAIPPGGSAQVHLRVGPEVAAAQAIRYRLANRPRGVMLQDVAQTASGVTLTFSADAHIAAAGHSGNAIVEVLKHQTGEGARGPVSLGVLPAIEFEVVMP